MKIKGKLGTWVSKDEYEAEQAQNGAKDCVDEVMRNMVVDCRLSSGQTIRMSLDNFKVAESLSKIICLDLSIKEHLRFAWKKLLRKVMKRG